MKTTEELKARARGIAEAHFYCDDECDIPWEPFEYHSKEWIEEQCSILADAIERGMLWAQS